MIEITIINSSSVKPRFEDRAARFLTATPLSMILLTLFIATPRLHYQSLYFVPSSAVPDDFEYTSKTFFPPQLVESGSSLIERNPQSARPVIGSTGIFLRNRSFLSSPAPSCTPFTSVSKSGG